MNIFQLYRSRDDSRIICFYQIKLNFFLYHHEKKHTIQASIFYKNLEFLFRVTFQEKINLTQSQENLTKVLLQYFRFFLKIFVFRQNRIQDNVNLLSMVLKEILSTSMESALYHKVSFEKRPDLLPNIVFIFLRPIYTSIFNCSVYSCYHYFIILYSKGIPGTLY